jgi:NADPH-dependent 2,4-dienoyl-CoA reductase/sulfur reductase-like enzyme
VSAPPNSGFGGNGLERVVVVGSSLAGLRACETLRAKGFTGAVTLVGAEAHLPYDRPPLSKKLLAGDWEPDRVLLRPRDALEGLGLDLRLGVPAAGLDVDGRAVELADGSRLPFDGLVIATGSRTRRLPGQGDDVSELRTLDDSLALRPRIADGTAHVVVIGAGFIGLEVAATAHARGCPVTVLEAAAAPLVRGLGPELGVAATRVHVEAGIDLRCGVGVAEVGPDRVRLVDGELIEADVVVVGVGVAPATSWLEGSGLELRDGVVCDETLRTAVPGIYAAGDTARWPHVGYGEELRIEHWTNAAEQGAAAAGNLLAAAGGGQPAPYAAVPFFWSDQGRHRIQMLGLASTQVGDDVEVVVGDLDQRSFVVLFGRSGRLRGALGVNAPKPLMSYQPLLARGVSWDDALAAATAHRAAQQAAQQS